MNNTIKTKSVFSWIVMLVIAMALLAAMMLVKQRQETRRGAYFSGAKVSVLPETMTAKLGDDVPVQLWIETANDAKVSAVDVNLCYGDKLIIDAIEPGTMVDLNHDAFGFLEYIKDNKDTHCLRMVAVSSGIAPENLKFGLVKVASIRFKSTAVGGGTIAAGNVKVSGYNPTPGATDTGMEITANIQADYTITSGSTTTVTAAPTDIPTLTVTVAPTLTIAPTLTTIPTLTGEPAATSTIVPTLTSEPTNTVTGEFPYLKFRMAFFGLYSGALCANPESLPLSIGVRAENGTSKVYRDVVATRVNTTSGLSLYDVQLYLDGFGYKDNVAVFVKSPKHLQVKYGKDGQDFYYSMPGSEIVGLTNDLNTTPLLHFEKYPLLAGDVTGPDGVQDGMVDGLDFSYVKAEAIARSSTDEGDSMLADLNGNCQMESQDLANLMISLSVKQEQLY